jgi:hypothetical protein
MDVEDVIGRLQQEGKDAASKVESESKIVDSTSRPGTPTIDNKAKHVSFSETVEERVLSPQLTAASAAVKYDADDDADASDVEDYTDESGHRSDDEGEPEANDETMIAEDEAVPQDMSTSDELALLQNESDIPIEELRKKYGNLREDKKNADEANKGASYLGAQLGETDNDEEFEPPAQPEVDDETTIEAEERLCRDMSYEFEINVLKRESEIPIEQLRAMYAEAMAVDQSDEDEAENEIDLVNVSCQEDREPSSGSASLRNVLHADDTGSDDEGAEEFEFQEADAVDDETTIEAEEKLGRDMSYQDEIALLKQESEMTVDELRAKYASMTEPTQYDEVTSNEENSLLRDFSNDENEDAEEFQPDLTEVDDETTLDAEERMGREMSHDDEMAILKRESEIPVEELRAMYSRMGDHDQSGDDMSDDESSAPIEPRAEPSLFSQLAGQSSENDDEEDFEPDEDVVDDETTIEAEERLGRDMSHEEEISMLKRESEMSVEELRKMYHDMPRDKASDDEDFEGLDERQREDNESAKRKRDVVEAESENISTKMKSGGSQLTPDDGIAALHALEASAQRAQQTLASRPFLLAPWVKLRHYQQVGLNWLVSLQSRRLNGVLADEMGLVSPSLLRTFNIHTGSYPNTLAFLCFRSQGKTLQTIALLSYLASYKGIWGPHLVIVPTSVIINWETELKRFCPALKVLTYYGSAKRRKELRQGWTKVRTNVF